MDLSGSFIEFPKRDWQAPFGTVDINNKKYFWKNARGGENLEIEANVLRKLNGDFVPKFHFSNENMIIMEFIEGKEFYTYWNSMNHALINHICKKIVTQLKYLYDKYFYYHHDLHEKNIMYNLEHDRVWFVDNGSVTFEDLGDHIFEDGMYERYKEHSEKIDPK